MSNSDKSARNSDRSTCDQVLRAAVFWFSPEVDLFVREHMETCSNCGWQLRLILEGKKVIHDCQSVRTQILKGQRDEAWWEEEANTRIQTLVAEGKEAEAVELRGLLLAKQDRLYLEPWTFPYYKHWRYIEQWHLFLFDHLSGCQECRTYCYEIVECAEAIAAMNRVDYGNRWDCPYDGPDLPPDDDDNRSDPYQGMDCDGESIFILPPAVAGHVHECSRCRQFAEKNNLDLGWSWKLTHAKYAGIEPGETDGIE